MKFNRSKRKRQRSASTYGVLEPRNLLAQIVVTTALESSNTELDGFVSLREAIVAANTDQPYLDAPAGNGIDKIVFDSSLTNETISLSEGNIVIRSGMTIEGPAKIDAAETSRHFRIQTREQVVLNQLELANGRAAVGGSIFISGFGDVEINASTLIGNQSFNGAGGAIYANDTRLVISNSTFESNEAKSTVGSSAVGSGGVIQVADGSLDVLDSNFFNNRAEQNGGAINFSGDVLGVFRSKFENFYTVEPAAVSGAFVFVNKGVWLSSFAEVEFHNGFASRAGGAMANLGDGLGITSSKFINNRTGVSSNNSFLGKGGALFSTGHFNLSPTIFHHLAGDFSNDTPVVFHSNQADSGGAIFQSRDSPNHSSIVNADFADNNANFGGAIRLFNANVILEKTTFSENFAQSIGGAIYMTNSHSGIKDPQFFANSAGKMRGSSDNYSRSVGGAIAAVDSSLRLSAYRTALNFESNSATGKGGAIALTNSSLNAVAYDGAQLSFIGNSVNRVQEDLPAPHLAETNPRGGAIDSVNSELIMKNLVFHDNQTNDLLLAEDYGGALSLENSTANLGSNSFTYNAATAGGAVSVRGNSDFTARSSIFRANQSKKHGGAIEIDDTSSSLLAHSFFGGEFLASIRTGFSRGNSAESGVGGAIFNEGKIVIHASSFAFNEASGQTNGTEQSGVGGAIFNTGTATITGANFSENRAGSGGAIHSNGNLRISNTVFQANQSMLENDESIKMGGAILSSGNTRLSSTIFVANQAEAGGALAVTDGELYARNVTFGGESPDDGNVANLEDTRLDTGRGGAVFVGGNARTVFGRSTFENNIGERHGGAIAIDSASGNASVLVFNRSLFLQNVAGPTSDLHPEEAPSNGGAIFVGNGTLDIRYSQLDRNNATGNGGAIYMDEDAVAFVRFSSLNGNSATEKGGAVFNQGTFLIADSTVFNNSASEFGAIADILPATSTIVRSEFAGNTP